MSRTDKTQPFRVRMWDGTLHRVAVHDHRDGICDLPADLAEDLDQLDLDDGFLQRDSCHWEFYFTGTFPCGCALCRDSGGLRDERRADRHRVRRALTDLLKEARHDWRDLD